jgi:4-hydroxybenzoate polyprenyltransferase
MTSTSPPPNPMVADAVPGNWVDHHAPAAARPYLRLARFDRPIGAWLLLFPCWWALALAEHANGRWLPNLWSMALFFVGAFVMRGAGCTWNDIVDRDFDAGVARTRSRPIPSGQVSVRQAQVFMVALALIGLLVLVQFDTMTIVLAIASLGLVALYPFAKRFTYWPQVVLGLTFKWGALVGWTAARGRIEWPAVLLYAGCVLWTIGYDTIYAHQDKDDDVAMGLKSTAIRFGDDTKAWVAGFYVAAVVLWVAAFVAAGVAISVIVVVGLLVVIVVLAWQVVTLDMADPVNCLVRFKSNRNVGWIVLATLMLDMGVRILG